MKTLLAASAAAVMIAATPAHAEGLVSIRYPDGRADVVGTQKVNEVLHTIGVHISAVDIPQSAKKTLKKSEKQALSQADHQELLKAFSLTNEQLLEQIKLAGRKPTVEGGGVLTSDVDGGSYPNINDMKAADHGVRKMILDKYGRLHVNSADDGTGIDEVMTVVSGGPFHWGFTLKDGTVIRFTVAKIDANTDKAIRVGYPGLGMHAGIIDPEHGLMVSYAHGPKTFVMRYESPVTPHKELLGTNPWIDFTGEMPKVMDRLK